MKNWIISLLFVFGAQAMTKSVAISPASACANEAQTLQFIATVTGVGTGVNWYVNGFLGGTATIGTISSSGLYKAPAIINTILFANVTAAIKNVGIYSPTAVVTLQPVVVAVSPKTATIKTSQSVQFTATVTGVCQSGVAVSSAATAKR